MPINLEEILDDAAPDAAALTPKWFHEDLTGNGRGLGLLNQRLNPLTQPVPPVDTLVNRTAKADVDADDSLRLVPVGIVPACQTDEWIMDTGASLLEIPSKDPGFAAALGVTPQVAVVHYRRDSNGKASRRLSFHYRVELYTRPVSEPGFAESEPIVVSSKPAIYGLTAQSKYAHVLYADHDVRDVIDGLVLACPVRLDPDPKAIDDWLGSYSLYDQLCRLARMWNDPASGELLSAHVNSLMARNVRLAGESVRYLENHPFPLEAYGTIDAGLVGSEADRELVRHQNLALLLYGTLDGLVSVKDRLPVLPPVTAPRPAGVSDEQWAAATSADPLTLVMAGAGSGKSATIVTRLDALADAGVDLSQVLVLSFTNAAADNITARSGEVRSMTIAKMVMEVYEHNHPSHRLSTVDTIVNSLRIFPDKANRDLDDAFAAALRGVNATGRSNRSRASAPLVDLSNFVSDHLAWVLGRLDRIGQTCLELTMIVSYLDRDAMAVPEAVDARYLVVDEVQDTSLYEFAYLMAFARQRLANLFMVGDPSQVLYEFRGVDPRALTVLAASPGFAKFPLTTNYRSNQMVLDFAELQKERLDGSLGPSLRLRSNSLAPGSEAEFLDAVRLRTVLASSGQAFVRDHLVPLADGVVHDYVEECLAKGERVAVLAPTRSMVTTLEKSLVAGFPGARVDNITSARRVNDTTFSKFVAKQWSDLVVVAPEYASMALVKLVGNSPGVYGPRWGDDLAKARSLQEFLSDWWLEENVPVNALVGAAVAGLLPLDRFWDAFRDRLLGYEIKVNAAAQVALQARNRLRKQLPGSPDVVVSTIHGVKGLEFDHVVAFLYEDDFVRQSARRTAHVALTRARRSELVVAVRTKPPSEMRADHRALAALYWRQDVLAAARDAGTDVDHLTDDELKELLEVAAQGREPFETEVL